MKYKVLALLLAAVTLMSVTGCSGDNTASDSAAETETVDEAAEKTASEQEMTRRYARLIEALPASVSEDAAARSVALHTYDDYFTGTLASYQSQLPAIREAETVTGVSNYLTPTGDPVLSEYSPLAALYAGENIDINPVSLFEKLEKPAAASGYRRIVDDLPETTRTKAELYAEREALIGDKLRYYVENRDYEIGYSEEEKLYYVYLVGSDTNLHLAALYFGFDDEGTLRRTGLDYVIYTGLDDNDADVQAVPLLNAEAAPLPSEEEEETNAAEETTEAPGLPVPEEEQGALYYTLRGMLYSMIGSAPKLSALADTEEVEATASVRELRLSDGSLAGLHAVNWYEIPVPETEEE